MTPGPVDAAGLVSWALEQAGVRVPTPKEGAPNVTQTTEYLYAGEAKP